MPIVDSRGKEVAVIKKKTREFGALISDADTFRCKFTSGANLSTKEKALLMGACFLIDFS